MQTNNKKELDTHEERAQKEGKREIPINDDAKILALISFGWFGFGFFVYFGFHFYFHINSQSH